MKPIKSAFEASTIKKGFDYVRNNGISKVMSNVRYKMTGPGLAYNGWYRANHEASEEELLRQSEEIFEYHPKISILVPVYLTPEIYLREMIESVKKQSYFNWELCIVDGSEEGREEVPEDKASAFDFVYRSDIQRIILEYAMEDERIIYYNQGVNEGISGSLDRALSLATGDYVTFLNHDDLLTRDALYEIVKALNEANYDFLYSDEDKCSSDGTKFSDPTFKPDFSLDLLRAYNYFGHIVAVKRNLAMKVSFRKDLEGAEDYDFNLRCIEQCVDGFPDNPLSAVANKTLGRIKTVTVKPIDASRVKHIPRVLYHSRIKPKSLDVSGRRLNSSGEVAKKALSGHLDRTVGYATAARTELKGIYKTQYETPGNPKVSIIISGVEDVGLLEKCITPLYEKNRYSNFEIVIIDPVGDKNPEIAAFYNKMESKRKNLRLITDTGLENTAQIRNVGAGYTESEFLLFIDGNIEFTDGTSIGDMVGACLRDEVGVVGGTIYTESGAIYKQGIILGVNGVIAYPNRGIKQGNYGYLMNNCINGNYLAVSAACMMVKTEVFRRVGGFDKRFAGEAAAIDFCLKARELSVLTVSVASAGWRYHEKIKLSRAHGIDEENEKMLRAKWEEIFSEPDPYYNVNFTRQGELFTL